MPDYTSKNVPDSGTRITRGDMIQNGTAVFNIRYIFIVWHLRKYLKELMNIENTQVYAIRMWPSGIRGFQLFEKNQCLHATS